VAKVILFIIAFTIIVLLGLFCGYSFYEENDKKVFVIVSFLCMLLFSSIIFGGDYFWTKQYDEYEISVVAIDDEQYKLKLYSRDIINDINKNYVIGSCIYISNIDKYIFIKEISLKETGNHKKDYWFFKDKYWSTKS
jgi:hypothetical protein